MGSRCEATAATPVVDARSAPAARRFWVRVNTLFESSLDASELESQQGCLAALEGLILGLIEHGGLVATGSAGQVESPRADGREARFIVEMGVAGLAND